MNHALIVDFIQFFFEGNDAFEIRRDNTMIIAIDHYMWKDQGDFTVLQWLFDNGCPISPDVVTHAASYCNTPLLQWLLDHNTEFHEHWLNDPTIIETTSSYYIMEWAEKHGLPWKYPGICQAFIDFNLYEDKLHENLQWIHDHGCPCSGTCHPFLHKACGKYVEVVDNSIRKGFARHRWMHLRRVARAIGKFMILFKEVAERRYVPGGPGFIEAQKDFYRHGGAPQSL